MNIVDEYTINLGQKELIAVPEQCSYELIIPPSVITTVDIYYSLQPVWNLPHDYTDRLVDYIANTANEGILKLQKGNWEDEHVYVGNGYKKTSTDSGNAYYFYATAINGNELSISNLGAISTYLNDSNLVLIEETSLFSSTLSVLDDTVLGDGSNTVIKKGFIDRNAKTLMIYNRIGLVSVKFIVYK